MKCEKEISPELVEKTREWLGKDGLEFFTKMKKEHGRYDAVFAEGRFPHAVHFREGMQVRNHMRETGLCESWDSHDFDNSWVSLITKAVEGGE